MGRRITIGIGPESFGSFSITSNIISVATADDDIVLEPLGNGTVELPSNYLARNGIGLNSVLPKNYIDNNISPGSLFINLS